MAEKGRKGSWYLSAFVKAVNEAHCIGMLHHLHDLKLTVLKEVMTSGNSRKRGWRRGVTQCFKQRQKQTHRNIKFAKVQQKIQMG